MITITSIDFKSIDFPDAATSYLDGNIRSRYKATVACYMQKCTNAGMSLSFNAATGVITNTNNLDTTDFTKLSDGYGFLPGETIIIPAATGSGNNTTLTLTGVTAKTLTVSNALTGEDAANIYQIFAKSLMTNLDYYYNLIAQGGVESYLSLTDINTLQKYSAAGLNANDTSTIVNLNPNTQSLGWVSTPTQSTIIGAGITGDYKQQFVITHYFAQAPFWLAEWYNNMQSNTPPTPFINKNTNITLPLTGYQYICRINDTTGFPVIRNTGNYINQPAYNAWYNQNDAQNIPDYTSSITYKDLSGNSIPRILLNGCTFTAIVKSTSGAFTTGTIIVLDHLYCPLDKSVYQNTPTTMEQNLQADRIVMTVGASAANGQQYGTAYQVFANVQAIKNSANQITVTGTINYSAAFKAILIGKPQSDRNCGLFITTE